MRDLGNKTVMARNLKAQMALKGVSAKELSSALNFPYTTVLSWLKGDNYPRIDKIEAMADYFGVLKSNLIEEKKEQPIEDGLSEKRKALMQFAMDVPEDKAEMILRVMKSILQDE